MNKPKEKPGINSPITSLLKKDSRKAWDLIKKINSNGPPPRHPTLSKANELALEFVNRSKTENLPLESQHILTLYIYKKHTPELIKPYINLIPIMIKTSLSTKLILSFKRKNAPHLVKITYTISCYITLTIKHEIKCSPFLTNFLSLKLSL